MRIITVRSHGHHGTVEFMNSGKVSYQLLFAVSFIVLMAGSVFIVSGSRFDLFETYRKYWTLILGFIILGTYALCKATNKFSDSVNHEPVLQSVVFIGILECLYALLQVFKVLPSYDRFFVYTGSFENPAVFAMLISICVPISTWLAFNCKKKSLWIITTLGMVVFTAFSESRTGLLAIMLSVISICIMESDKIRKIVFSRLGVVSITLLAVLLISYLYYVKADSANGRFLIWKVSLSMFRDRPLFGWGVNGFSSMYMTYQAQYLNAHPDSVFLLLADNPSNPFNEFIGVLVNYGLIGLTVVLAFIVTIFYKLFACSYRHKSLLIGLTITLIVWSSFSYPFSIPFIWIVAMYIAVSALISRNKKGKSALVLATVSCFFFALYFTIRFIPERRWKIISDESIKGRCEEMLPYFEELSTKLSDNGLFMYNWAAELHYARRYEESANVFNSGLHLINDYDVQMLLADDYQQMGNTSLAVEHYDLAASMVPSRFLPYYYKMKMYMSIGDTVGSLEMANHIVNKEVKVKRSKAVQKIIEEASEFLNQRSL